MASDTKLDCFAQVTKLLLVLLLVFSALFSSTCAGEDDPMVGIKIAYLVSDGVLCDDITTTRAHLDGWGANTSIWGTSLVVTTELTNSNFEGDPLHLDNLICDLNVSDFDCLVIPGGSSPENLAANNTALEMIQVAFDQESILAAIGNGPIALARADVVNGTTLTGDVYAASDIEQAGGTFSDTKTAIVDGQIVSSSVGAYESFALAIAEALGFSDLDVISDSDLPIFVAIVAAPVVAAVGYGSYRYFKAGKRKGW